MSKNSVAAFKYIKRLFTVATPKPRNRMTNVITYASLPAIILIITAAFVPITISFSPFLIVAIWIFPTIMAVAFFEGYLRYRSYGLTAPGFHSSLSRPSGSWDTVPIDIRGKKRVTFHIFDAGGVSVPLFQHVGGGKAGYFIVPENGFILEKGSVLIHYKPRLVSLGQLPLEVQKRLKEHENFKPGTSPIFFCALPEDNMNDIMKKLSKGSGMDAINDIMLLAMSAFETASHADSKRHVEQARSMEGFVGRKSAKQIITQAQRDEEDE